VVVGRTWLGSVGREQLVRLHQPQHAAAADNRPKSIPQSSLDFAVPHTTKRRGPNVGSDHGQQAVLRDATGGTRKR
jgi:hypothetical protein